MQMTCFPGFILTKFFTKNLKICSFFLLREVIHGFGYHNIGLHMYTCPSLLCYLLSCQLSCAISKASFLIAVKSQIGSAVFSLIKPCGSTISSHNWWQTGVDCVICIWNKAAPSTLREEELVSWTVVSETLLEQKIVDEKTTPYLKLSFRSLPRSDIQGGQELFSWVKNSFKVICLNVQHNKRVMFFSRSEIFCISLDSIKILFSLISGKLFFLDSVMDWYHS